MTTDTQIKAEVIAVFPDKVKISVDDIAVFSDGKHLKVGSYLRITDSDDCALIAIIENFCIEVKEDTKRRHVIEALPLGIIRDGKFIRGGDTLTIPPTGVTPATEDDIKKIFEDSVEKNKKFTFCTLGKIRDLKPGKTSAAFARPARSTRCPDCRFVGRAGKPHGLR